MSKKYKNPVRLWQQSSKSLLSLEECWTQAYRGHQEFVGRRERVEDQNRTCVGRGQIISRGIEENSPVFRWSQRNSKLALRLLHDASGDIHRISTDLADLKKEIDGTAENMRKTKYKGVHWDSRKWNSCLIWDYAFGNLKANELSDCPYPNIPAFVRCVV